MVGPSHDRRGMIAAVAVLTIGLGLLGPCTSCRQILWLWFVLQAIPTVALLTWTVMRQVAESRRYRWSLAAAFALSCIAASLLLFTQFFAASVLTSVLANAAYIAAFTTEAPFARRIWPFVILGVPSAALLAAVWPQMPADQCVLLLCYAVTIVAMPAQAITRALVIRRRGAYTAAIGATLLLVSDSLLGVQWFYTPYWAADFFIMATYYGGQWLIAWSIGQDAADGPAVGTQREMACNEASPAGESAPQ